MGLESIGVHRLLKRYSKLHQTTKPHTHDDSYLAAYPAAIQIGLRLSNMVQVELADGSIKKEFVFEAKAVLDGETIPVDVLLTSSDENLVGTAILQNQSLMIDFKHQLITLDLSPIKITVDRG